MSADASTAGEPALRLVLCNAPPDRAEEIANAVLELRLAACVNILPGVVSLYWWEGVIQREIESTLLIKTTASHLPALTAALLAAHPYAVPEVLALPFVAGEGNPAYRAWLSAQIGGI
jgi:periplasmic divalent cation tolerance protein